MTSTIFDDITNAFLAALQAGTLSLGAYSLPLLGAFALMGWYWNFGRSLALGGGELGDALAAALLYAVNIGVAYWLLVNLSGMATAAYQTFLQWGLTAGGAPAAGVLLTPSAVVDMGFQIAAPKTPNPSMRSPGSLSWAGINNTFYWIDPQKQIGAVILMQMLPFYDEAALRVLNGFEQRVYTNLK